MGASASAERRDVPRRPFQTTVVLGHPGDGEQYEADAVDLSIGGMSLKTEFLPDLHSELSCRFMLETGTEVEARGEVMWARDEGPEAGAFGLRFTDMTTDAEDAIRRSLGPKPRAKRAEPARAKDEVSAKDDGRARLHISGMDAPLRARVRTRDGASLVLGSDLSFLKLGETLEVERGGEREPGRIEDVGIEVDPQTNIARLVLTIGLHADANAVSTTPEVKASRRAATRANIESPTATEAFPLKPRRGPAQATEVLASHHEHEADAAFEAEEPEASDDAESREAPRAHAVARKQENRAAADAPEAEARRAPPWLVNVVRTLRAASQSFARNAGPKIRGAATAFMALVAMCVTKVRALLGRPTPAATDALAAQPGGRRRQQSNAPGAVQAELAQAAAPRKKIGLYVLAGAGVLAIGMALMSSSRTPRPRTPRPQVALAPTEATAEAPALPTEAALEPSAAAASADGANAEETMEPTPAPTRAGARGATTAARAMPADLVGAARSRSADVSDSAPMIRNAGARGPIAQARANTAHAAAAPAAAQARSIGNAALQSGTVLRLRMDGAITALAGGPGAGNTLTIRVNGRRSLDMAAPLVRQDARLVNAGVMNRATGAELTLRFRDAVPVFAARARGTTLEIVLAPPARRAANAPAPHAVSLARHGR